MPPSALLGQPPISSNDELVYKGIREISPGFLKALPLLPHVSNHSRAPSLIIGSSFAIALGVVITCARLWVRTFRTRAFGADDVVIIFACIGCVAYLALNIGSETAGCLGKHIYNCTYEEIGYLYELAYANFPIFYLTVFLVKISIVLQNRRITGITSPKWQIAHWTYLALLLCLWPICVFLNVFPCRPIATAFTLQAFAKVQDPRTIKCLDTNAISLSTRSLHIITDWLILPVPLIIIWRLQMPMPRRIRLMLLFSLGLLSSIASIIRNYLIDIHDLDVSYNLHRVYAWDVVDIFFALIVASLPALNGVIDAGVSRLKTWVSVSTTSRFGRFSAFGASSQHSRSYHIRLPDREGNTSFRNGVARGKESTSSDPFQEPMFAQEVDVELQRPADSYKRGF